MTRAVRRIFALKEGLPGVGTLGSVQVTATRPSVANVPRIIIGTLPSVPAQESAHKKLPDTR